MVVDPVPSVRAAADAGRGRPPSGALTRSDHRVGRPDDRSTRSDTVTRPSVGMRAAMAEAEVGDDQFGDDPTVNRLQERVAGLLGGSRALVPTGTMANQVVLRTLTSPGDDVIVSRGSHAVWHEIGGSGANAGVQLAEIGRAARLRGPSSRQPSSPRATSSTRRRRSSRSRTPNRAGGVVVPRPTRRPSRTPPVSWGSRRTSTAPDSGTRRSSPGAAWRSSPLGSTSRWSRSRRASARPADPSWPPRATESRRSSATAACRAGRCARSVSRRGRPLGARPQRRAPRRGPRQRPRHRRAAC